MQIKNLQRTVCNPLVQLEKKFKTQYQAGGLRNLDLFEKTVMDQIWQGHFLEAFRLDTFLSNCITIVSLFYQGKAAKIDFLQNSQTFWITRYLI